MWIEFFALPLSVRICLESRDYQCLLRCQESEIILAKWKIPKMPEKGPQKSRAITSSAFQNPSALSWPQRVMHGRRQDNDIPTTRKKHPSPNLQDLEMDGFKVANRYEARFSWVRWMDALMTGVLKSGRRVNRGGQGDVMWEALSRPLRIGKRATGQRSWADSRNWKRKTDSQIHLGLPTYRNRRNKLVLI